MPMVTVVNVEVGLPQSFAPQLDILRLSTETIQMEGAVDVVCRGGYTFLLIPLSGSTM